MCRTLGAVVTKVTSLLQYQFQKLEIFFPDDLGLSPLQIVT